MRLTKSEVKQLYSIFSKVDLDGSGSVDIVELLTLLDVERTAFTEQVFHIFDSDGSGKVDFREFVLALWNYCTIGSSSLGKHHKSLIVSISHIISIKIVHVHIRVLIIVALITGLYDLLCLSYKY